MSKEKQDILKSLGYDNLPSHYLKEDNLIIDNLIDAVNSDLEEFNKRLKNTADFVRDAKGYFLAQPKNKNPRKETLNNIKNYNTLSIYSSNLSNIRYFKEKSGTGMIYFNNPIR